MSAGTVSNVPCLRLSEHLEDFNLAGGRVEVLRVVSAVSEGERVDLDPEGDALLSAVLPGSELRANAVHLQTAGRHDEVKTCLMWKFSSTLSRWLKERCMYVCVSLCGLNECQRMSECYLHKHRSSFVQVPQKLCSIQLGGVSLWLHNAH